MKLRHYYFLLLLFVLGCVQIEDVRTPCSVTLKDGTVLELIDDVRFNTTTGTVTYRDELGRLRSIFREDYDTTTCRNQ